MKNTLCIMIILVTCAIGSCTGQDQATVIPTLPTTLTTTATEEGTQPNTPTLQWDIQQLPATPTIDLTDYAPTIDFSKKAKSIIAVDNLNKLTLLGKVHEEIFDDWISCAKIVWSEDSETISVATKYGIRYVDTNTMSDIGGIELVDPDNINPSGNESAVDLVLSPDGKDLAIVSYLGNVRVWKGNESASEVISNPMARTNAPFCIIYSSNGKRLFVGSRFGITIYDSKTLTIIDQMSNDPNSFISSLSISPNDKYLATSGSPDVVTIWDLGIKYNGSVEDGARRTIPEISGRVKYIQKGRHLLIDHTVIDTTSWKVVGEMKSNYGALDIAVEKKEKYVVFIESNGDISFWSLKNYAHLFTVKVPVTIMRNVSLSPDGKMLATTGYDGYIYFWGVIE